MAKPSGCCARSRRCAAPGASYVDYPGGTAPAGEPANTLQPYLQSLISALPSSQQPTAETLYVFYFPLPSVLVAILNQVFSFAVAFKLVTVLGTVTLPASAYIFGRLAGFRRPTPIVMAAAMLPFLRESGLP